MTGSAPEPLVQTEHLTKRYGVVSAVEGLDLTVYRGEVYGFLGPNGAGKSTTLRMLVGLIRPTSGTALVLGEKPGYRKALSRVGALVESPTFYPFLSAYDNLKGMHSYSGRRVSRDRVMEALDQVGLRERARDKYKKYSLGMKQRLGVAAALLKDPELLILDEPTNGLDPQGMAEMRRLIRELGRGERTVLLSSHLMGEVEQVSDRVGIIRKGTLVAEGTVPELRGEGGLLVKATPADKARKAAKEVPGVKSLRIENDALRLEADPELAPRVARALVEAGVELQELRPVQRSLEEAFFELTTEQQDNREQERVEEAAKRESESAKRAGG